MSHKIDIDKEDDMEYDSEMEVLREAMSNLPNVMDETAADETTNVNDDNNVEMKEGVNLNVNVNPIVGGGGSDGTG